ncbi:3,4-dihydroxy-2-butanone-4-phosphate synthase [Amphritea sp.]
MVILVDDEDRENEGDLVMVGSAVTPNNINFMAIQTDSPAYWSLCHR